MMPLKTCYPSPIGSIEVVGTRKGILSVSFSEDTAAGGPIPDVLTECIKQLDEYFKGKRKTFSLPLLLRGTVFQQSVWRQLTRIPYGKTSSYKKVARSIGKPGAVRAVGNANGTNPVSIIVPCHRVVGHNGHLTGYGSGLWRKEWLLHHEGIPLKKKTSGMFVPVTKCSIS